MVAAVGLTDHGHWIILPCCMCMCVDETVTLDWMLVHPDLYHL